MTTYQKAAPIRRRGADSAAKANHSVKLEAEQTADPGETRWSQASGDGPQKPVPQQPNELDESASSQKAASASMEGVGRAAYHDAVTSEDTDRGPVMDAVYNGPVTEGERVGDDEKVRGERDPLKSTSSRHR